jgi:hypothetical protein
VGPARMAVRAAPPVQLCLLAAAQPQVAQEARTPTEARAVRLRRYQVPLQLREA